MLKRFSTVVLHKVYFDKIWPADNFPSGAFNIWLSRIYDRIESELPFVKSIEVPPEKRKLSTTHIWGDAPMHFQDEYYIYFLKKLGRLINAEIMISSDKTLQKV